MTLAFVFDSVGAGEWLLLLAVLLVVIGPKRLPGMLRKFGSQYAKFRRAADSFKRQLMEMDTEFERAVDSAAREAEEAAKIPDVGDPSPEAPEERQYEPPEGFDVPEDVPSDTPPEMPVRSPEEADGGAAAQDASARTDEPVEPDGNRDTKEP